MANEYRLAYPVSEAAITARLFRDSIYQETITLTDHLDTPNDDGVYYGDAIIPLSEFDDIVYFVDGTTIVASETVIIHNKTRWNLK